MEMRLRVHPTLILTAAIMALGLVLIYGWLSGAWR